MLCACWQAYGQTTMTPDRKIAPLDQYLMERNAEIALARSAAPDFKFHTMLMFSDVFVLGPHRYEIAVKSKNGFAVLCSDPGRLVPKTRTFGTQN
jgi:hypothetical protein